MSAAEHLTSYDDLFLSGDASTATAVYDEHRDELRRVVEDESAGVIERVLAAEVLYRDGPPAAPEVLAPIYTRALALTGAGGGPVVLYGNLWGARGDPGPLGGHLVEQGEAAVPGLQALLDDEHRLLYQGSREAMAPSYRVMDAAAYYLELIHG